MRQLMTDMRSCAPMTTQTAPIDKAIQRRNLKILMGGVVPAGAGMAAGYSAAAVLGEELSGSASLGTFAAVCMPIGGTVAAVPLAAYMSANGRRPGMRLAWAIAAVGAGLAFLAAWLKFYPLLPIGMLAFGLGNAANLSARYAAADVASEEDRAKSIGTLVWSGTFGSALGPTLGLGVAGTIALAIGLPELSGPYLMAGGLFLFASIFIDRFLRPDPLELVGGIIAPDPSHAELSALRTIGRHFANAARPIKDIVAHPSARLAVAAMVIGQAVMVAVMTATPLHMKEGAHELRVIGIVISVHIVGMYFFSPVVGWLVDRIGPRLVIGLGGVILFIGSEMASHTPAASRDGVLWGLFLVGLGWSFGLIAGSSLLVGSFDTAERVSVQGAADLMMNGAGALAGISAGLLYEFRSYHDLSHYSGLVALSLTAYAAWRLFQLSRTTRVVR